MSGAFVRMAVNLRIELKKQMEEGAKIDKQIWENMKEQGYGG
jgi:hypothetical protein